MPRCPKAMFIHLMLCIDGVWHCSKGLDYGQGTVKRRRSYCSKQRGYIKTRLTLTQTISKMSSPLRVFVEPQQRFEKLSISQKMSQFRQYYSSLQQPKCN